MGQYAGVDNWVNQVYQFEETDLVQAATDNVPLQHLADRTVYLKNQIGLALRLDDQIVLTGSAPIPAILAGHAFIVYSTGFVDLTLDSAASFRNGSILVFNSFCTPNSVINVKVAPGDYIYASDGSVYEINMHHKEHLTLMAVGTNWIVINALGNFYCAGEEIKGRKVLNNTLRLDGSLLERARYPRLWKFINSLSMYQEVVPEYLWFSDDRTYRGCFTDGNGLTTFRLPDERGTFDRMLDLGRGLDFDRMHNFPGGYEADELKAHTHDFDTNGDNNLDNNPSSGYPKGRQNNDNWLTTYKTKSTGGAETRPKNTGKLNLIKF